MSWHLPSPEIVTSFASQLKLKNFTFVFKAVNDYKKQQTFGLLLITLFIFN